MIMYSIGNEIGETVTERGVQLNRRIADRARQLDSTRLITNCINGFLNLIGPKDDAKLEAKAAKAKAKDGGAAPNKNLIVVLNYLLAVLDTVMLVHRPPSGSRQTHPRRVCSRRRGRVQLHARPLPQ